MARSKRKHVEQKTNGDVIENNTNEDVELVSKRSSLRKRKRKFSEDLPIDKKIKIKRNTSTGNTIAKESKQMNNGNNIMDIKLEKKKYDKKSNKEVEDCSTITCAICKMEMLNKTWKTHKEKNHNNLAWKFGDTPLDLNDKQVVTSALSLLYKQKKNFKCEVCNIIKKSVVGFMSHMDTCSKTEEELEMLKVKCEICNKKVMPSSMYSHMKLTHHPQEEKKEEACVNVVPKTKRQSAIRVSELLKTMRDDDEEEEMEKVKTNKLLLINFNFHSSSAFKKHLKIELKKNESIRCKFNDCEYRSTIIKEFLDHVKKCTHKFKINRTCCLCFKSFEDVIVAEKHLKECKADNDEDDEDDYKNECNDTIESTVLMKKTSVVNSDKKYQIDLINFIPKNGRSLKACYWPSYEWMQQFCGSYYNVDNLYEELKPNILEALPQERIVDYLPLNKISLETNRIVERKFIDPQAKNLTYKRFKLFESIIYTDGNSMVFCGGSITKIAWCPTPNDNNCDQIISVAVNLNPNDQLTLSDRNNTKGLLQFWNFGLLNFMERSNTLPTLEFCFAHDFGRVYDIEWCPSGCYDTNRLGLLAIACSDSFAYVHSIQQPKVDQAKVLKSKPLVKLVLNSMDELNLGGMKYQATKLSWSKARLHEYVAVGYSNGLVALYKLEPKKFVKSEDIPMVKPFKTFYAHNSAVTALCLYHMGSGWRWLMTGSTDRMQKFWDLKTTAEPVLCHRRSNITDGKWPINWIGGITSQDDGTVTHKNSSAYCQVREVGINPTSFLYANSTINSVTICDWGNVFVHGTSCGEINGSYPNQIFQNIDLERTVKKKKFYVRQTVLIDKNLDVNDRKELEKRKEKTFSCEIRKINFRHTDVNQIEVDLLKEPLNYYEADKQYKMLFLDYNLDNDDYVTEEHVMNVGYKSKHLKKSRWNRYDVQSVNNVAFNPNKQSFLYMAAGYKAGFLTCNCIRFLRKSFT